MCSVVRLGLCSEVGGELVRLGDMSYKIGVNVV